jgi:2-dehydropantoate 2-reductase
VRRAVAQAAEGGALVVTLQNGLGNREAFDAAAGAGRVAVGVATLGATLLAPGRVRAFPGEIVLGLEGCPEVDHRLQDLARLLSRAGLPTRTAADVRALVWGKLAVNCAINPLAALTGLTNGALLEHPRLRALLGRAAREVAEVAGALGIPFEDDAGARAEAVAAATAGNRASMLQDLERGAPTEIDALCGAVVGQAARHGVRAPVNEWLWRSVRARESALAARPRRTA